MHIGRNDCGSPFQNLFSENFGVKDVGSRYEECITRLAQNGGSAGNGVPGAKFTQLVISVSRGRPIP